MAVPIDSGRFDQPVEMSPEVILAHDRPWKKKRAKKRARRRLLLMAGLIIAMPVALGVKDELSPWLAKYSSLYRASLQNHQQPAIPPRPERVKIDPAPPWLLIPSDNPGIYKHLAYHTAEEAIIEDDFYCKPWSVDGDLIWLSRQVGKPATEAVHTVRKRVFLDPTVSALFGPGLPQLSTGLDRLVEAVYNDGLTQADARGRAVELCQSLVRDLKDTGELGREIYKAPPDPWQKSPQKTIMLEEERKDRKARCEACDPAEQWVRRCNGVKTYRWEDFP